MKVTLPKGKYFSLLTLLLDTSMQISSVQQNVLVRVKKAKEKQKSRVVLGEIPSKEELQWLSYSFLFSPMGGIPATITDHEATC